MTNKTQIKIRAHILWVIKTNDKGALQRRAAQGDAGQAGRTGASNWP